MSAPSPEPTSPYFVMSCDGVYPSSTLGQRPELPRGPWMTGQMISYDVPQPLVYALDPDYPGDLLAMYKSAAPLMRSDLIAALAGAGVDNLQFFDAVLQDPQRGSVHQNYKAVNVVGVVSVADLERSSMMGTTDSTMIDADFHRLVFRDKAPSQLLMFRLAESVNAVVVHERVKSAIEAAGIPGMTFYASGEWSG